MSLPVSGCHCVCNRLKRKMLYSSIRAEQGKAVDGAGRNLLVNEIETKDKKGF